MASPLLQLIENFKKENIIQFLQEKNLIPSSRTCQCGNQMNIQKHGRVLDGFIFRCSRCKITKSIKEGRFFQNTRISLSNVMQMVFLWVLEIPVCMVSPLLGVSETTCIQWYNYCRDICAFKMTNLNEMLGGVNQVVEIDESLMFRRKNNMGRVIQQFWIFGMYDVSRKRGYLMHVQHRDAVTLIPIIRRWVASGTTIYSDEWGAYASLSSYGYDHHTVNHTQYFTDPETGATTNHVEAYWSRIKRRLKYISGSQGDMRWSHLDEACYRHWFDFKSENIWENLNFYLLHLSEFNNS